MANKTNHPVKQFCKYNHDISIFGRSSDGHCNECERIYQAELYLKNKEKIDNRNRQWNKDNKEQKKIYDHQWIIDHPNYSSELHKKWYLENRLEKLAKNKKWDIEHPEVRKLINLRKQKKRRLRIPKFGQEGIVEFYKNCPSDMVVDHVIPLCGKLVSGLHVRWNLQYLTPEINRKKGNR